VSPRQTRLSRLWETRNLSIVLFALYAVAQVVMAIAGWMEYLDEQQQHGEVATVFGDQGYIWPFLEQTLQNQMSEWLALFTLVSLTAVLIHRGSKHSRDGQDEVQQRVQRIQERVDRLAQAKGG
jgi:hypothetical protein